MKLFYIIAAAAFAAQQVIAHPEVGNSTSAPADSTRRVTPTEANEAAVRAVLAKYQSAIERLDARGTEQLFTPDSAIFETGGVEGTYTNYLSHHLAPELAEFKSFRFADYKVDVRFEGPVAIASESYKYRIETKKGEVAERVGVATSVLKRVGRDWRILSMHNSGRKPKVAP